MIAFVFQPKRAGQKSRLWSARIQITDWPSVRTIPLEVADRRVAEQKLWEMVKRFEREAAGIDSPAAIVTGAGVPIAEHLKPFLGDLAAKGRSVNTRKAYGRCIVKLCTRCGWKFLRDVTVQSFIDWRARGEVGPKMANDVLGYMCTFLTWLQRRGQLGANPLANVEKVKVKDGRGHRRAFSEAELRRLVGAVPPRRAAVYVFAAYTGLRRWELNRLTWADVDVTAGRARLPDTITKNSRAVTLPLSPDAVAALRVIRPDIAQPFEWVFRGKVPNMETFHRDLKRAQIPQLDEHGRRVDFHALRTTFCTMLQNSGVTPRAAMELMRHSDMKLTMRVYTDASLLGLRAESAKLPALGVALEKAVSTDAQNHSHIDAQTGVKTGRFESPSDASSLGLASAEKSASVAVRRTTASPGVSGAAGKMVDLIRFELTEGESEGSANVCVREQQENKTHK